jgi:phosphohistidine swiveling domain-containing protein
MIDQMLPAKSRFFLLNVGSLLVQQGVINNNEDIFHLYLDEVKELLVEPKSVEDLIEQRKQVLSQQKTLKPAPFFGEPPTTVDPIVERIFGLNPPKINEENQSFDGYAGSKGVYTGKVRIIKGQEEFHTFKKGEILVSKLTLPPWTVLFGLAGAIVTDTGGILSHTATVAREYKVPAVVGTKVATSLLDDGDIITVNGTEGVVTIESKYIDANETRSAI